MAIYEKGYNKIPDFPDLKLFLKCLVDDGSYEAQLVVYDINVIYLMKFNNSILSVKNFYVSDLN